MLGERVKLAVKARPNLGTFNQNIEGLPPASQLFFLSILAQTSPHQNGIREQQGQAEGGARQGEEGLARRHQPAAPVQDPGAMRNV